MSIFSLVYQSLTGHYQPQGNINDGDFIIADAWGKREYDLAGILDPGPTNADLANFICSLPRLSMAVPEEVRLCLPNSGQRHDVIQTGTIKQRHYAYEVLEIGVQAMYKRGRRRPILVTDAHLVPRAVAIMRRLGVEPIVPPDLPSGFDPQSSQKWLRSPLRYALKEPLVWAEHLLRHRISLYPVPSPS